VIPPGIASPFTGYASAKYQRPEMWLCRPDLPGDRCRADLAATEIHPDGTRSVVAHTPAADPKVDCFYVYPTVDLRLSPGNHTDFADVGPMARAAAAQAARLGEVCRVYAPLYRQITIGTYAFGAREERLSVAFSDVADAFAHYLGQHNGGRKIALVGHSQGAEMVVRLLRRFFEDDPRLRERLLVALAVGGHVEVPRGKTSGGTLPTIPLCTRDDELGCVIAFRTHRAGSDPTLAALFAPSPGHEVACVNPASVRDNQRARLSRTYFPVDETTRSWLSVDGAIKTPFLLYRGFYGAECATGRDGYRYLSVWEARAPGDARKGPIDLGAFLLNTSMGLHVLDMSLPQGDLIDVIARRAAALDRAAPPPPPAPPAAEKPSSSADPLPRVRPKSTWQADPNMPPDERVRRAEADKRPIVERMFAAAGVNFPPEALLFRAFKQEKELEVWAASKRGGPLSLIATYEICRLSGDLGPKRKEGDLQVPEGFYHLHYLWPDSAFHLELKVGYPNDLDRHLSDHFKEGPGGNIMIHGSCASVGCLAMTDERIAELWVMASAFQRGDDKVAVHIYPARDMAALLRDEEHKKHWSFWANLKEGYDLFERTHRLFRVEADWHARYWFK
jgi:hypothetical protein